MVIMNVDRLYQANENWCLFHGKEPPTRGPWMDKGFQAFAETQRPDSVLWHGSDGRKVAVNDHTARCIEMLTSPHWRALMKAWSIQQASVEVPK